MKPLLTLSFLMLLAAPVRAYEWWENWLTLLEDPASTAYDYDCLYQETEQSVTVQLCLARPVNPDFDGGGERDVTRVAGFECAVTATEGLHFGEWIPAGPATVEVSGNSLRMMYDEPLPVTFESWFGRVVLATCQVDVGGITGFELPELPVPRCTDHANAWTYVVPGAYAAVPGAVSFIDADDPQDPLVVPRFSGDRYDLKFEIHQAAVPANAQAWGAVKARYR